MLIDHVSNLRNALQDVEVALGGFSDLREQPSVDRLIEINNLLENDSTSIITLITSKLDNLINDMIKEREQNG